MPHRKLTIQELTRKRDKCKQQLDDIQAALNKLLIANGPVHEGDIIRDADGKVFRVLSVSVKTIIGEDGGLTDRLTFEFQKRRATGGASTWQRMVIKTTGLTERVISGEAKIVRHTEI